MELNPHQKELYDAAQKAMAEGRDIPLYQPTWWRRSSGKSFLHMVGTLQALMNHFAAANVLSMNEQDRAFTIRYIAETWLENFEKFVHTMGYTIVYDPPLKLGFFYQVTIKNLIMKGQHGQRRDSQQ